MELVKLLAEVRPEDVDKLMEILPLIKEKANLERRIAESLSGCAVRVRTETGKAAPTVVKSTHVKPPSSAKKVDAKSVVAKGATGEAVHKENCKTPSASKPAGSGASKKSPPRKSKRKLASTEIAAQFLQGKKDAAIPDILQAVADVKRFKLTTRKKNSIRASLYNCPKLKNVGEGRFALA